MAGQQRGGTLRPQDERRLKAYLDNLAEIAKHADWLRANIGELYRRAQQPLGPDGYPTDVGSTPMGSSGGVHSPVESVVVNEGRQQYDQVREAARFTTEGISSALGLMRVTRNRVDQALATQDPMRSEAIAGAGSCVNCGDQCTGVGEDRLKAGRCPACYLYRWRNGGADRALPLIEGAA